MAHHASSLSLLNKLPESLVLAIMLVVAIGCGHGQRHTEAVAAPLYEAPPPDVTPLTADLLPDTNWASLSEADRATVLQMRQADIPAIKAYVRGVLAMELPEDFELPRELAEAGSPHEAELLFMERYPMFYGKQGPEYLQAIAQHPVLFRHLIKETLAVRRYYGNLDTE